MSESLQSFDVIIAGGALTGASVALALSSLKTAKPLSIAVVDSSPMSGDLPQSYDARVIALSHGSALFLKELGVWSSLKQHAEPIKNIHISDRGHFAKARLSASEQGVSALGYVAEMQAIGNALLTKLKQQPQVQLYTSTAIEHIAWQRNNVTVRLSDHTELKATLLLGCDGANSVCRKFANIDSHTRDYGQTAIIANVSPELAHQGRAFERFTESGPIALLPMTNGRCSLVWTVKNCDVANVMALDDANFADALSRNFGTWLGHFNTVGKRFSYPLILKQVEQQTYPRMALLGNAAHTLHPIAGQGFNLGVRDVKDFANVAQAYLHAIANNAKAKDDKKAEADLGRMDLLTQYANKRFVDQQQVIQLTDSLVHIFSNNYWLLALGRGAGLTALNQCDAVKSLFAAKTMGHF
ncbi:2-octaprenyl-6-methoxyphenyl hydroxylase [Thalassotalea aquiviva]|uniref:2-octaprenyl-6-methoxyphenyl hydroxylase n=1 Tax=Thalassotalea aquiviva TaxID=3242415 RepID=UPI003529FE99